MRWSKIKDLNYRINQQIRTKECRVVSNDRGQLGIMSINDALDMARKQGLDLIEIDSTGKPPVCLLANYGKLKYEKEKSHKKPVAAKLKVMKLNPDIGEHDIQFKLKNVLKFLNDGDKVKFSIFFKGREITHTDMGQKLLERFVKDTSSVATVEKAPALEGRSMIMILSPKL